MLSLILKRQLLEINRTFFYSAKSGKSRSRLSSALLIAGYVLLMAGCLGGIFTFLSLTLCAPLTAVGADWLYFALLAMVALALGVFGSVFNTYAGLYLAKDNDLLLSLPIPVKYILAGRLLGVYLMGLMFSAVVIVPAVIVYFVTARLTAASVVGCILLVLLISLTVLVLSCLLGWVVAKVSLKFRRRSFVTVLATLVFLGLYYFVYFKASGVIRSIVANAAQLSSTLRRSALPLYAIGRVGTGRLPAMLGVSAADLLLLALTYLLLSRSFWGIAVSAGSGPVRTHRPARAARDKSPSGALLGKELARFASSPGYMLNCAFGALLALIAAAALLIKGGQLREIFSDVSAAIPGLPAVLLAAALCLLAGSCDITAPSVSLEGKHLWLVQSLPVSPWQVLRSKLRLHLLITCPPTLLCSLCAAVTLRAGAADTILLFLLPQLSTLLFAALGLTINLKRPNLTWTNEIVPVKQSLGVLVTLLASWLWAALSAGGYFLLRHTLSASVWLALFSLVTALLAWLLLAWLRRRGTKILSTL